VDAARIIPAESGQEILVQISDSHFRRILQIALEMWISKLEHPVLL
jgi:hypothetical protein